MERVYCKGKKDFCDDASKCDGCSFYNGTGITTIEHPDMVIVTRCKNCKFATELDKHCDINRTAYKHCSLLRGDETRYVWHKYKKYYKDYSLVELDDYCSFGERRSDNG